VVVILFEKEVDLYRIYWQSFSVKVANKLNLPEKQHNIMIVYINFRLYRDKSVVQSIFFLTRLNFYKLSPKLPSVSAALLVMRK